MTKFTNISSGPRGLRIAGDVLMVEKGQTVDVDLADGEEANKEWFTSDDAAAEPGPLDGSVDDLTAHLTTVADADEVQALIDAETAGKSRKGALAALEARRDELLAN